MCKPSSLALVKRHITLGIIADEHFSEGRVHRFDVLRKVLSIGELELLLAALLHGDRRNGARTRRITRRRAEFLVHQDTCAILGHPSTSAGSKACIDTCLPGASAKAPDFSHGDEAPPPRMLPSPAKDSTIFLLERMFNKPASC